MNLSAGDNQTQPTGTVLAANLVVVLRDNFNNPVAGRTVTFRLVGTPDRALGVAFRNPDLPKALPGDDIQQAGLEIQVVSDATGTADIQMTLGDIPGVYRVEASVAGLPPVYFNETAIPGDYDLLQNFPNPQNRCPRPWTVPERVHRRRTDRTNLDDVPAHRAQLPRQLLG